MCYEPSIGLIKNTQQSNDDDSSDEENAAAKVVQKVTAFIFYRCFHACVFMLQVFDFSWPPLGRRSAL